MLPWLEAWVGGLFLSVVEGGMRFLRFCWAPCLRWWSSVEVEGLRKKLLKEKINCYCTFETIESGMKVGE